MRLEAIRCPEDHEEECPTCGGGIRRRVFGEMHAGSFVLDGQRVEIRGTPDAEYRDPIHLDEITQYFDGGLYRMWPSERYLSRGGRRLHRDVWKAAFGAIPAGCHIHHRDGNVLNNRLSNLECLEARQHLSDTWHGSAKAHLAPDKHFSDAARDKAAEWHGSDEGRLWHKRHAERTKSWTKWKREDKPCEHCGTVFSALVRKSGNAGKYCATKCKVAAYRDRGKANEYSAAYRAREAAKRKS